MDTHLSLSEAGLARLRDEGITAETANNCRVIVLVETNAADDFAMVAGAQELRPEEEIELADGRRCTVIERVASCSRLGAIYRIKLGAEPARITPPKKE